MSDTQANTYRDRLGIVDTEGGRSWIYPRKPSGRFTRMRTAISGVLLAVLFGMPLLTVNGHPFMLLNVLDRQFILFGVAFGPQDFYLFVLLFITLIVSLIIFTMVFGRIFCGWICPQTVFMEMVFRRIDFWLEGDHHQQRRLRNSPWTAHKIVRKAIRYLLYFLISFLIGNTLLAWVIGFNELRMIVTDPLFAHPGGLTAMLLFTALFYWIFIWFREQACILVCPYGRLQGVLLDPHSIVIAYDYRRGEPRGKRRRNEVRTRGDCVDCGLCVDVCPTGIDIRDGTQLECVNCAACIDACDAVMDKLSKPRGLIRYASAEGITLGSGFQWTGRIVSYTVVLIILLAAATLLLFNRTQVDVTVLRTPGMFFQEQPDGKLSNVYDVKILNKTFSPATIDLKLVGVSGEIRIIGEPLTIPGQGIREDKILIVLSRSALRGISTPLTISVSRNGREIDRLETTFLGPGRQE